MYRLFKNITPLTAVVLPDGKRVEFIGGLYVTRNKREIEELDNFAENEECGVYVDSEDTEVSEGQLDEIRGKMIAPRKYGAARNAAPVPGIGSESSATKTAFQASVNSTASALSHSSNIPVETVKISGEGQNAEVVKSAKDRIANR